MRRNVSLQKGKRTTKVEMVEVALQKTKAMLAVLEEKKKVLAGKCEITIRPSHISHGTDVWPPHYFLGCVAGRQQPKYMGDTIAIATQIMSLVCAIGSPLPRS